MRRLNITATRKLATGYCCPRVHGEPAAPARRRTPARHPSSASDPGAADPGGRERPRELLRGPCKLSQPRSGSRDATRLDCHPAVHSTADRSARRPPRRTGPERGGLLETRPQAAARPRHRRRRFHRWSFVLLYGQQLARVAAMTRSPVHDRSDSLSVRFGTRDVEIRELLAGFVRAHLDSGRHYRIATAFDRSPHHGSLWLVRRSGLS